MKYTAIIFDMDGTILHSENVWQRATQELLQKRGVIITPEIKEYFSTRLHGTDIRSSCSIIKEYMGFSEHVDDLVNEKRQLANSLYPEEVQFIDGFLTFHQQLINNNCAVGVATNANISTVQAANSTLNLEALFGSHIYTIDHVGGIGKPNPLLFEHAAEKLGHAPAQCIVIEDSPHGVFAAKKAGMFCVGINTANRPELLWQADMLINHYDELDAKRLLEILD